MKTGVQEEDSGSVEGSGVGRGGNKDVGSSYR